jgi:hypothetical protein
MLWQCTLMLRRRGYNLPMQAVRELIIEVVEDAECGYRARALGEGIFTHGADLEELKANIREAVDAYFDAAEKPAITRLHFLRDEVLTW